MNIKQNKHKQELKEDPVMDWMLNAKDSVQKNKNKFIGAAIIIAVLFAGGVTFKQVNLANQKKARDSFGAAMISYQDKNYDKAVEQFTTVVTQYGSTSQGIFGAYMVGSIYQEQKKYNEAIDWYKKAISSKSSAQFVSGQALEGISACYESLGQVDEAIKHLEAALKDSRVKHRHAAIKWKIALLSSSANIERTKQLCKEIIADTSADDFRQKAENLLITFEAKTAG